MQKKIIAAVAAVFALSLSAGSALADETGAKNLFFQQLDEPKSAINTGVRYWVELRRGGQSMKVNNKMAFRSGDKIRFHVQPNIDGRARKRLSGQLHRQWSWFGAMQRLGRGTCGCSSSPLRLLIAAKQPFARLASRATFCLLLHKSFIAPVDDYCSFGAFFQLESLDSFRH